MQYVVTNSQMKEAERRCDQSGISYYQMMENARSDPRRGRFSRYQRRIGTNRGRRNEYVNVTVKLRKLGRFFIEERNVVNDKIF